MTGRRDRPFLLGCFWGNHLMWVAVIVVAGILYLGATTSVAAKWEDKGIQRFGDNYVALHVFENVADDGKVYERIFVPETSALGSILATRIMYINSPDGRREALVQKLILVGIEPDGVELLLLSGRAEPLFWSGITDTSSLVLHYAAPIEKEDEKHGRQLSFRTNSGIIRLWVSGFTEITIDVHLQGVCCLWPKASLMQ